jgi:hypothetical protein
MKKLMYASSAALVTSPMFAQSTPASVPTSSDITAGITAAGAAAGAAAVLGLSIWVYRKIKAKAGQAIG